MSQQPGEGPVFGGSRKLWVLPSLVRVSSEPHPVWKEHLLSERTEGNVLGMGDWEELLLQLSVM